MTDERFEFTFIEVSVSSGRVNIAWSCKGIGFGSLYLGYCIDTECMDAPFIEQILIAAAPQLAEAIIEAEEEQRREGNDESR